MFVKGESGEKIKGYSVMKCKEILEIMSDLASGRRATTAEMGEHLAGCGTCTEKLEEFRKTMALLDEWRVPEPSQYFDVRLQARVREEMGKASAGWWAWVRRPALAASLTVLMAIGLGLFFTQDGHRYQERHEELAVVEPQTPQASEPGTAVGDLQALEKDHDLYSDFDLLDDMEVQHDVTANP